jgi:multiple sugar transport system substrate-binding protein
MRRSFVALLVAVVVAACSSTPQASTVPSANGGASPAPSGSGSGAAAPVTISYLTHWPPETVAKLQAAADAFTSANPNVTVDIRAVPFGNLLSTLRTQAASPNGPTITGIYDLWLPELVRDGIAAKAPDAVASDAEASWTPNILQGATVDGALYGYPNEIDVYALNYNKKLFAEAGISEPPKTWDELTSAAEKLTKRDGSGNVTQQGFGLINSWAAGVVHPWLSMTLSNGGTLVDGTTPTIDQANAVATTDLYERLVTSKITDPTMGTANATTTGPFLDNFTSGKTAMIIMANWWESALKSAMGDAFADVGTAPIPVGPDGDGSHSVSYSWLTAVNANASPEQQDAAWKFLTWLHSPDSGEKGSAMGDMLMSMGILPCRTSDVEAYATELGEPFLKAYVDSLANAVPFPIVLGGQEMTEALQKQIENVEFGRASAGDAMKAAQDEASQILKTYYP